MAVFRVAASSSAYDAVVERGILQRAAEFLPAKAGAVFVVTTEDVWRLHGSTLQSALGRRLRQVLFFAGGEEHKRLSEVERLAEELVQAGADRSSLLVAFGGGIVNDVGGFLAAIFMRGIPVLQIPTTLLAQVDAAVGGKTGVNLVCGKNLVGSFHQPVAVLIDPDVLRTLPEREYRAGLFEIIKCGVIRSPRLFDLLVTRRADVFAQTPAVVEEMIGESVRIKAEVVAADEREGDLRRILNFGHTLGHALEAETGYSRFLHGEAVAFGMKAATHLARLAGVLGPEDGERILSCVSAYGPIPSLEGIQASALVARLGADKKTVQGKVHFVLPERIGAVKIVSGLEEAKILEATEAALR
ncbi:MAG: 3-dehydroquinate synthase [Bryobacteraceae bacterium]|nr:3-dehydroquinate synthase [Bryobacteraceae bacterium]MDW8379297.1 3-dehydroquinate synthase [Bryobacterales bacterium]